MNSGKENFRLFQDIITAATSTVINTYITHTHDTHIHNCRKCFQLSSNGFNGFSL